MKQSHRLDKILAKSGYGSRKDVKQLVKSGAVSVNGKEAKDSSLQVDPDHDTVTVNGHPVDYREFIYLMMHKPGGVISATEDRAERTVLDLLDDSSKRFAPFPVGRLDKDTTGLLLLTNDGKLAHELLSPKKHVPKTYAAVLDGPVGGNEIAIFKRGVILDDGYQTLPAVLEPDAAGSGNRVRITIHEGKFHQVKRMFRAVGRTVVRLERIRFGTLLLDDSLAPGHYRELNETEVHLLKNRSDSESIS